MLAYINGRYLDESQPAIPVNDRSFRYGDGLFETIRIATGQPFLWHKHFARLQRGAAFLKIKMPEEKEIQSAVNHLLLENKLSDCFVRIHLSRGSGRRGYSFKNCEQSLLVITTHDADFTMPGLLQLITSTVRILANDPAAQFKTANRLPNILAKNEADLRGADEALLLNDLGNIAGASAANLFCIFGGDLVTPPLSEGALAGTTREFIQEIAPHHGLRAVERPLRADDLYQADAVFLTSTLLLATPVGNLNGVPFDKSVHNIIWALQRTCENFQ